MNTAIRFDRVSKCFILRRERPRSFQELALNLLHGRGNGEDFWALRDVDFTVEKGEMVGLIGPNGAGKSTVLKLISRIIEPTSGQIAVNGRLSALLELGAGFHPDLTGRENIYLNGSILGLSRAEMQRKFDSIVSFAEMERFVDVPLKRYSSGMAMRLGFAVAVHVEPDVLLVDEVLAVGDYSFQAKCIEKIGEMRRKGVTILFVSHDLDTVQQLCDRVIWLHDGRIVLEGNSNEIVEKYIQGTITDTHASLTARLELKSGKRWGSYEAEITGVRFYNNQGIEQYTFETGQPFIARIYYEAHERINNPLIGVAIHRMDGTHINGPNTSSSDYPIEAIEGKGTVDYIIKSLPLLPGTYLFSAAIYDHTGMYPFDHHDRAYTFKVRGGSVKENLGIVYIPCRWEHRRS